MYAQIAHRWRSAFSSGLLALSACLPAPPALAAPTLSLPIACKPGSNCFIQNYVDTDPDTGVSDWQCGQQSYDGHKGTDIRLLNTAAMLKGVRVLAAAAGTVKGVRDGVTDISIRDRDASQVSGRECGNGVVVDHGGGWVTQYCHMKKGSLRVASGAMVKPGTVLGEVGLSGMTEFAHLHFEVRHDRDIIDPFTADSTSRGHARSCKPAKASLWKPKVRELLAYRPVTFVAAGFTADTPNLREIEKTEPAEPTSVSPALLAWVRLLGVRQGDTETITVTDPLNQDFAHSGPAKLEKSKAQWLTFAGRKRTVPSWPLGKYVAHYTLQRRGKILVDKEFSFSLVR